MKGGIEAIDLLPAISPALLASVKALLEGDGFCRLKHWINGAEVTAGLTAVASTVGKMWPMGCLFLGMSVAFFRKKFYTLWSVLAVWERL